MTAKTLIVTGAGRGIGAAIARLAGAQGYRVAVNYNASAAAAEEVVRAIQAAGGEAFAIQADVSREADIVSLFDAVDKRFGRIDALVNNAGVVDVKQRVDEMDAARMERMLRINTLGPMLCCREAVRRMSTRHGGKGGAIVSITSMAAVIGGAGEFVDYAASKGAMDSFTIGLSREVAAEGIRVNAIRPGVIETDLHASGGQPDRVAAMVGLLPMRRAGLPEEVAAAAIWLLSQQASYSTGSILNVSGGR